ncbi:ABC transporter substrate-binding protein ['Fragaria x ananassa' phyllody phytoplasma]|uniref:ABC transporter substrate-binding protein n=1 Tax='Fragaria x ananassa' phyllody phytoplasma TaxID=2358428 RepID=A0ABS5K3A5_9MOLU|nr:ABC transporter substrate-binding protein ['Fragaria x ananassa' phyllody phytoplasma]MBS2126386.1 ABC transporter substrate-binding protein ['Fragaria x ananassa' phyllody phytoplasma]
MKTNQKVKANINKNKKIIILVTVLSLAVLSTILLIWKPWKISNNKDTVNIAMPSDIKGFDVCSSAHTNSAYSHHTFSIMHDTLLYKDQNGTIHPRLADLIEEKNKELTFKIKDNILFHNGNRLTTDDVIFTFERGTNKKHPQFLEIEKIDKIDDKNFKVTLKTNPLWKKFVFYRFFNVLNKEAVEKNEKEGLKIGAGPYKLIKYEPDHKLNFELFDNYYNKERIKNSPKQINLKISKDDDTNLQEIQNGALDGCLTYPDIKINDLKKNLGDQVKIVENNSITSSYIYINKQKIIDKDTRKAIYQALNLEKIKNDLELPVKILNSYLPNELKGNNPKLGRYQTDIVASKKYVEKLTLENKKLNIGISSGRDYTLQNKIIEQLKNVGFDATLSPVEFNTLLTDSLKDDSPYHMIFLKENHEMEYGHKSLMDYFLTNNNQTNLCHINEEDKTDIEDKLMKAIEIDDENKYIKLIQEVSRYIHDQVYVIPLYKIPSYVVTSPKITQGFETDDFSNFEFTNIRKQ